MSFQVLLVITAFLVLGALAVFRVVRVRSGREAQPEGWRMLVLDFAFLIVPPILLQVLVAPTTGPGQVDGVASVFTYGVALILGRLAMWIAAVLAARYAPHRWRHTLLIALSGSDNSAAVVSDPPMSTALTAEVESVDARNAAFPRGSAFLDQVDKPGFRAAWDALDGATTSLEHSIADASRRGGVASRATSTAADARGRLDALRRDAAAHGQAWAASPDVNTAVSGGGPGARYRGSAPGRCDDRDDPEHDDWDEGEPDPCGGQRVEECDDVVQDVLDCADRIDDRPPRFAPW